MAIIKNKFGGVIEAGVNNTSSGDYSSAIAGQNNCATSVYSVIAGGCGNQAIGYGSFVGGGLSNSASGSRSSVIGGSSNTVSGQYAIAHGRNNTVTGNNAVSFGQLNNSTFSEAFTVGLQNTASGRNAVALGYLNTASGRNSFAVGQGSVASNERAVALGGSRAEGSYSVALGGGTALNTRSFAVGASRSYLYGMQSYASGNMGPQNASSQASIMIPYRKATLVSGETAILSLDGTGTGNLLNPFSVNNRQVWNVTVKTIATVESITGTADGITVGDTFMENAVLLFKTTPTTIVDLAVEHTFSEAGLSTADITYTTSGTTLQIAFVAPTFTGGGSIVTRVVSKVEVVETTYGY